MCANDDLITLFDFELVHQSCYLYDDWQFRKLQMGVFITDSVENECIPRPGGIYSSGR